MAVNADFDANDFLCIQDEDFASLSFDLVPEQLYQRSMPTFMFGEEQGMFTYHNDGVDPLLNAAISCDALLPFDSGPSVMVVEHITVVNGGPTIYMYDEASFPVRNALRVFCIQNKSIAEVRSKSQSQGVLLDKNNHCNYACINEQETDMNPLKNKLCPRPQSYSSLHTNATKVEDKRVGSDIVLPHEIAIYKVPRRGADTTRTLCVDCVELPIDLRFLALDDTSVQVDGGTYSLERYDPPIKVFDLNNKRCMYCSITHSMQYQDPDDHERILCASCGPGTYSSTLPSLTQKPTCFDCELGSFSSEAQQSSCLPCPPASGNYLDYTAVTPVYKADNPPYLCLGKSIFDSEEDDSLCINCTNNTFCGRFTQTTDCPVAEAGIDGTLSYFPDCPIGHYCVGPSTKLCPPGYYQDTVGNNFCMKCSEPGEKHNPNHSDCTICPAGYKCFWDVHNTTFSEIPCPIGTFAAWPGSLVCSSCPEGKTNDLPAQASCKNCIEGHFCSASAGQPTMELPCPFNTYNDVTAQAFCKPCPSGKITMNTSSLLFSGADSVSDCTECPRGLSCPEKSDSSASTIKRCKQNFAAALTSMSDCTPCLAGKYRTELYPNIEFINQGPIDTNLLSPTCFNCPAGKTCCFGAGGSCEVTDIESQVPANCSRGRYSNTEMLTLPSCPNQCPGGSYYGHFILGGMTAKSDCSLCPAGHYCPGDWVSEVQPAPYDCPENNFCTLGSIAATPCNPGRSTNSLTNADHRDNCTLCIYGKATDGPGTACSLCPPGKISTVDFGGTTCFDCPNPSACMGGGNRNCSIGYEGNLCGTCSSGYYTLGNDCNQCADTPILTIIGVVIALIIGYSLSQIDLNFHHLIRLKIYSTFAQLLGLIMYMDVPWPPLVKKLTSFFLVFSLNIDVVHPDCIQKVSFYEKYAFIIIFPVTISVLFFFGDKFYKHKMKEYSGLKTRERETSSSTDSQNSHALSFKSKLKSKDDIKAMHNYRRKFKTLRQFLVIFITCSYSPLVQYSLKLFDCTSSDQGNFLSVDTDLECSFTDPTYFYNFMIAVVILCGVGLGIPICITMLINHLHKKLNTAKSLVYWGALYEWYRDEYAWFEAVSLGRKFSLLLSISMLDEGFYQLLSMSLINLIYAAVIHKKKPFILFPLRLLLIDNTVDFYNFLEFAATITTVFNLFLGTMAKLDTTQEAADSIGVVFVFTNAMLIVLSVVSYEYGIHHSNSTFVVNKQHLINQHIEEVAKKKEEETRKIESAQAKQTEVGAASRWKMLKNVKKLVKEDTGNDDGGENVGYYRGRTGDTKIDLKRKYSSFFNAVKDPVISELSEKYEEEWNLMMASQAGMNLGDAHALKMLLYRTRLQLLEELDLLNTRYNDNTDNEANAISTKVKKDCLSFWKMVTEDWPDSNEYLLRSKLSELAIMYSDWRSNYRHRLTSILKKEEEEFKRQDKQRRERVESMFQIEDEGFSESGSSFESYDNTKSLSDSRSTESQKLNVSRKKLIQKSFTVNKHRVLSIATAGELRMYLLESNEEVKSINNYIEKFIVLCLNSHDYLIALRAQELREKIIFEHEEDADCVEYGLDPSTEGRKKITASIRSRELSRILPYFGFSSLSLALCQASISSQAFGSYEGLTASFLSVIVGFLCFFSIKRMRSGEQEHKTVNLTVVLFIGLLTLPICVLSGVGNVKDTTNSQFRSFRSASEEYLQSQVFLDRRAQYVKEGVHNIGGKRYDNYSNSQWINDAEIFETFWGLQQFSDIQYCPDSMIMNVVGNDYEGWGKNLTEQEAAVYQSKLGLSHTYGSCRSCGIGGGYNTKETVDNDLLMKKWVGNRELITDVLFDFELGVRDSRVTVHRCEVDGFINQQDDAALELKRLQGKYWTDVGVCRLVDSLDSKVIRQGIRMNEDEKEFLYSHMAGIQRCMSCDEENGFELVPLRAQRGIYDRRADEKVGWCSGVCVKAFTEEGKEAIRLLKEKIGFNKTEATFTCKNDNLLLEVRYENLLSVSGLFCLLLMINSICLVFISFFGKSTMIFNPKASAMDAAKVDKFMILAVSVLCTGICLIGTEVNLMEHDKEHFRSFLFRFVGRNVLSLDSYRLNENKTLGLTFDFSQLKYAMSGSQWNDYIGETNAYVWLSGRTFAMNTSNVLFLLGIFGVTIHVYKQIVLKLSKIMLRTIELVFFWLIVKNRTPEQRKMRRQITTTLIGIGLVVGFAFIWRIWEGFGGWDILKVTNQDDNSTTYQYDLSHMKGLIKWCCLVFIICNLVFFAFRKLRTLALFIDFGILTCGNLFLTILMINELVQLWIREHESTLYFLSFEKLIGIFLCKRVEFELILEIREKKPEAYEVFIRRLCRNNATALRVLGLFGVGPVLGTEIGVVEGDGDPGVFSLDFESLVDESQGIVYTENKAQATIIHKRKEQERSRGGEVEMGSMFSSENPMLKGNSQVSFKRNVKASHKHEFA